MTKREAIRQHEQSQRLQALGFTESEAEQLRRISNTLRRWYEHECNGTIQRDEATGIVRGFNPCARYVDPHDPRAWYSVRDREKGAIKRLQAIMQNRNMGNIQQDLTRGGKLAYYLQTDPRGAALYIIRPGDVPEGQDVSAYYTRGICVY